MVRTKALIIDVKDIPSAWIFQNYLNLEEELYGQELVIHSPFNRERTPSMTIFCSTEALYSYKDFSSGNGGSGFDLVQKLFKLRTKSEAIEKVVEDYREFILKNGAPQSVEYKVYEKFKVKSFCLRGWNTLDKQYWGKYGVGSKTLERYNVAALDHFVMSKKEDGVEKEITIKRRLLYGFFDKQGNLYKIYQPDNKECKFVKVRSYIMGDDQLHHNVDNLLITKSMKDIVTFVDLKIVGWEAVSPESENTLLPEQYVREKMARYKNVIVLMDNDRAGKEAADAYLSLYGLKSAVLGGGEKDLSDTVEKYGKEETKKLLKL